MRAKGPHRRLNVFSGPKGNPNLARVYARPEHEAELLLLVFNADPAKFGSFESIKSCSRAKDLPPKALAAFARTLRISQDSPAFHQVVEQVLANLKKH